MDGGYGIQVAMDLLMTVIASREALGDQKIARVSMASSV
jgi:hypothetical protein